MGAAAKTYVPKVSDALGIHNEATGTTLAECATKALASDKGFGSEMQWTPGSSSS